MIQWANYNNLETIIKLLGYQHMNWILSLFLQQLIDHNDPKYLEVFTYINVQP